MALTAVKTIVYIIIIAGDSLVVVTGHQWSHAQYQLSSAQGKLSGDTLLHEKTLNNFYKYCTIVLQDYNWWGAIKDCGKV